MRQLKSLRNYIYEGGNSYITSSNAQRKQQLIDHLTNKGYKDYIKELNKMLDDPKLKALLEEGFGGELGDMQLKFSEDVVSVSALSPTQSEIDITKSINYGIILPDNIDKYFSDKVVIKLPLVTFKGEFVIDGHHRWSQVFAYNPNAKMIVYDYSSKEINSIQMLKATQGAIAAVKAASKENNGKLPQDKVDGMNIYKMSKEQLVDYIKKVCAGKVPCVGDKTVNDNGDAFVERLGKYVPEVHDVDSAAEYIAKNMLILKANHSPIQGAPSRSDMPQTDKGSIHGEKDKSYKPTDNGSALNRLKDKKFVSNAVR